MNVMSVLRGLDKRASKESTPIFDQLEADCGSLLVEAPWQPELLKFQPWNEGDKPLEKDYELPPMPFYMALTRVRRLVSAQSDTQLMQVIS